MELTGNDVLELTKEALRGALVNATQTDREEYLQWATEMAPMVTIYATRAASGDPAAKDLLVHIRAQAETKFWILKEAAEIQLSSGRTLGGVIGEIASTAATVAGSLLTSLVTKYGIVLLGLA